MMKPLSFGTVIVGVAICAGCHYPEITAVPLSPWNRCEPEGIPFYLPKPILIVAKNFRNIEEAKVGLTDGAPIPNTFDDQAKYADLNARTDFKTSESSTTSVPKTQTGGPTIGAAETATASGQHVFTDGGAPISPGTVPGDGLAPDTFFTYQIVFIPDMTQKYGLKIKGGTGEIRAALNLVNGWQFAGMGPYYMKNSSTAQNVLAGGVGANLAFRGVADVVRSVAQLQGELQSGGGFTQTGSPAVEAVSETLQDLDLSRGKMTLDGYAEIHVYEPYLTPDGMMMWRELIPDGLIFDRDYLGAQTTKTSLTPAGPSEQSGKPSNGQPSAAEQTGAAGNPAPGRGLAADPGLVRAITANALGIPLANLYAPEPGTQAGLPAAGTIGQVNVNYGSDEPSSAAKSFGLLRRIGPPNCRRPQVVERFALGIPALGGDGNQANQPHPGDDDPRRTKPQEASPGPAPGHQPEILSDS